MEKVKFIKDIQVPNMTVTGDIEISGNMTVQGESVVSSLETVVTPENTIVLRSEATEPLLSGTYTGIVAEKYDGTNNGMLVFDKDGTAYVGDEGDLQPLATRTVSSTDNNKYMIWDATKQTLKTGSLIEQNGNTYINDKRVLTETDKEEIKSYIDDVILNGEW